MGNDSRSRCARDVASIWVAAPDLCWSQKQFKERILRGAGISTLRAARTDTLFGDVHGQRRCGRTLGSAFCAVPGQWGFFLT